MIVDLVGPHLQLIQQTAGISHGHHEHHQSVWVCFLRKRKFQKIHMARITVKYPYS